jgi:hypothetical protein
MVTPQYLDEKQRAMRDKELIFSAQPKDQGFNFE